MQRLLLVDDLDVPPLGRLLNEAARVVQTDDEECARLRLLEELRKAVKRAKADTVVALPPAQGAEGGGG
jgi:hypothetical protein